MGNDASLTTRRLEVVLEGERFGEGHSAVTEDSEGPARSRTSCGGG